jgi:tetratricopeptide (TPR) repeat protein
MRDAFGNTVHCVSPTAVRAYDRAVDAYLHALPGVLEATDEALANDPQFAVAHALRGLFQATYGRGDEAKRGLARARECSAQASERERSQVDLITTIIEGRTREALAAVEHHAQRFPTDVVAIAPALGAYGLFAFSGRRDHDAARLAWVETLAPHHPSDFAWLLAHRGWCRIECGSVDKGLAMVLQAIVLRPANGHNAHMVMHGYYEKGDHESAKAFLTDWMPSYPNHALMWGHLQWHWALTELYLGRYDLALARLLGPILDYLPRGSPYMGLPDAVSLLWRLGLRETVPSAWSTAREHASRHFPNGSNTFGELHLAMLAAAYRNRTELEACKLRLQSIARTGHAGAEAVVHWAAGLRALVDGDKATALSAFDKCRAELPRLGGSHAQRGIVEETMSALRLPAAEAAA